MIGKSHKVIDFNFNLAKTFLWTKDDNIQNSWKWPVKPCVDSQLFGITWSSMEPLPLDVMYSMWVVSSGTQKGTRTGDKEIIIPHGPAFKWHPSFHYTYFVFSDNHDAWIPFHSPCRATTLVEATEISWSWLLQTKSIVCMFPTYNQQRPLPKETGD